MQTPQKPRPAPACVAYTMSIVKCLPQAKAVLRAVAALSRAPPAPALRAQAGFLASFRVRHFAVLRGWSCLRPYHHMRA
jgi:hypothetical protein